MKLKSIMYDYQDTNFTFEFGNRLFIFDAYEGLFEKLFEKYDFTRIGFIYIFSSVNNIEKNEAIVSLFEKLNDKLNGAKDCPLEERACPIKLVDFNNHLFIVKDELNDNSSLVFPLYLLIPTNDEYVGLSLVVPYALSEYAGFIIKVNGMNLYYTGKTPVFPEYIINNINNNAIDYVLYSKEGIPGVNKDEPFYYRELKDSYGLLPKLYKFIPIGGFTEPEYKWFNSKIKASANNEFNKFKVKVVTTE